MAQFSVKIMRLTGSVLGENQHAVLKRIYSDGFPARQRDLVVEMQEWFIANSAEGDAPDESTISRRIQAVWKELNPV